MHCTHPSFSLFSILPFPLPLLLPLHSFPSPYSYLHFIPFLAGDINRPEVLRNFDVGRARAVVFAIDDKAATNKVRYPTPRATPHYISHHFLWGPTLHSYILPCFSVSSVIVLNLLPLHDGWLWVSILEYWLASCALPIEGARVEDNCIDMSLIYFTFPASSPLYSPLLLISVHLSPILFQISTPLLFIFLPHNYSTCPYRPW